MLEGSLRAKKNQNDVASMLALLDSESSSSLRSLSTSRTYAPRDLSVVDQSSRRLPSDTPLSIDKTLSSASYVPYRSLRTDSTLHYNDVSVPTPSVCSNLVTTTLKAHRSSALPHSPPPPPPPPLPLALPLPLPLPLSSYSTYYKSCSPTRARGKAENEDSTHKLHRTRLYGSTDLEYQKHVDKGKGNPRSSTTYLSHTSPHTHTAPSSFDETLDPHSRTIPQYTDEIFDIKLMRAYEHETGPTVLIEGHQGVDMRPVPRLS